MNMMISYQELVRTFPSSSYWEKLLYDLSFIASLNITAPLDELTELIQESIHFSNRTQMEK